MDQTTQLAHKLDVAPDTLETTLGEVALSLRYARYYSFRNPDTRRALRPVMTSAGHPRLVAFLTPDDGAALARRGLGGSILPMTTVDDRDLLLALLVNAALGDLVVFEKPISFEPDSDDPTTDMSLVTRGRLLTAIYQRALLSQGKSGDPLLYVRCITWLDQQGAAGDDLLAATAFMLWRLVLGSPATTRELVRVAGVDEDTAAALLARALAAVQSWYAEYS